MLAKRILKKWSAASMQRLDMICVLFFSKLIVGVILGSHASSIYRGDGSCAWFSMDTQESQASCFIESLLWSFYMLSVGQDPHFMAPWGLGHPSYVYKTASKTIPPGLVPGWFLMQPVFSLKHGDGKHHNHHIIQCMDFQWWIILVRIDDSDN